MSHTMNRVAWRVLGAWGMAALLLTLIPPAAGSAMILRASSYGTLCANPNSMFTYVIFRNLAPADNTWTILMFIGLNGGADITQNVDFVFILYDEQFGYVGRWQEATSYWWVRNNYAFSDTVTTHYATYFTLYLLLYNQDPT